MLKGFKDFMLRGNVVELAVAVVMGAAITAVVVAFGDSFLQPTIALMTGGEDIGGIFTINGVEFNYGSFISALIVFALTAATIYFLIVVPFNRLREKYVKEPEAEEAPDPTLEMLTEIRDALREQGRR